MPKIILFVITALGINAFGDELHLSPDSRDALAIKVFEILPQLSIESLEENASTVATRIMVREGSVLSPKCYSVPGTDSEKSCVLVVVNLHSVLRVNFRVVGSSSLVAEESVQISYSNQHRSGANCYRTDDDVRVECLAAEFY